MRGHLPREPVDRITRPLVRFLRIETASGTVLLASAFLAIVLSNSPWSESYLAFWDMPIGFRIGDTAVARSLREWINDGWMTLFFFVVALELKREIVLGELRDPPRALLSLAGAVGGMVVPIAVFLLWSDTAVGWGSVMATDTAFVVGCLALLGSRVPHSLRLFLLSLAVFDDVGAILVVALAYGKTIHWGALTAASLGLGAMAVLARIGVRSILLYTVAGIGVWAATDRSGIHATLVGVLLGLMTPARSWITHSRLHAILNRVIAHPDDEIGGSGDEDRRDLRRAGVAAQEAFSPVERLEFVLHPWIAFIVMPVFALANAGVVLAAGTPNGTLTGAIVLAFLLGKPAGVFVFSYLSVRLRLAIRPPDLPWSLIAAGGLLTGIGFTMALLIANLAFQGDQLLAAKLGIMAASVGSATCGLAVLRYLTRGAQAVVHVATAEQE